MSNAIAYPRFELADEEKKALKEAQYFESMASSPGWQKAKQYISSLVQEAHDDMAGNLSNDPVSYMRLQIRWQQRHVMMLAINQHVESMIETKKELVKRATEDPNEYDPFYTDH